MGPLAVRVMTCNLRFPSASDAGNLWEDRRALAVEMFLRYAPDVIGLQEAYRVQLEHFARHLPGYACVGRERYGGSDEEHNALFVRSDRYMIAASGTYWLSDAPDVPGSRSWRPEDHPRIVTWVRVRHLQTARELLCLNTHFHLGDDAPRMKSVSLIWEWLHRAEGGRQARLPAVLMGDFNSMPGSAPHRLLTGADPLREAVRTDFRDAWEVVPNPSGPAGTYHGFTGTPRQADARIDWILFRGDIEATAIETVTFNRRGKYPSDHFPVVADFVLGEANRERR